MWDTAKTLVSVYWINITVLINHTPLCYSPTIECISTTPVNIIPADDSSTSSTSSTVCSEIDKILESARRLSISNLAKEPVKPCRLVKPPSHTAAKTNQACTITTKTRFKQTESINKSSIQQSVKHVKTGPSAVKQATPPNLVTKVNDDTKRVSSRRVPMRRVPILIETMWVYLPPLLQFV